MRYHNFELHNVAELLDGDGGSVAADAIASGRLDGGAHRRQSAEGKWFCRIPDVLRRKLNPMAQVKSMETSGSEIRFNLRGDSASAVLHSIDVPGIVELWQGCFPVSWHVIGREPTTITMKHPEHLELLAELSEKHRLPFDARLTRLRLPWRSAARLHSLDGEVDPPRPDQTPARRYLAYGSSITHGNMSIGAVGGYAHRTAERLGADLINLGFGGGAHLEAEIAEHIAARDDWDFASVEMGINIGNIDNEEYARRVERMLTTISSEHPGKWIFCIDVFPCREDLLGGKVFADYRRIVAEILARLNRPKLVHVHGDRMLTSLEGLTVDLVHPSPFGMEEMARNLGAIIGEKLGPAPTLPIAIGAAPGGPLDAGSDSLR